MKLSALAQKPQLIKVSIDDEDIVTEFGEAIDFWTWDRHPMDTCMKLAALDQSNPRAIIDAVRKLVLDEEGKEILDDQAALPTKVMTRVLTKVVEGLGKL
jgi:hypothetical protein